MPGVFPSEGAIDAVEDVVDAVLWSLWALLSDCAGAGDGAVLDLAAPGFGLGLDFLRGPMPREPWWRRACGGVTEARLQGAGGVSEVKVKGTKRLWTAGIAHLPRLPMTFGIQVALALCTPPSTRPKRDLRAHQCDSHQV